mmetsp:Transcript_14589/g.29350  ORF Transcript_14589/g.29350 Transcript_14589/m.29350 type:complete len:87 (-) Transcript_14589:621-881(-)
MHLDRSTHAPTAAQKKEAWNCTASTLSVFLSVHPSFLPSFLFFFLSVEPSCDRQTERKSLSERHNEREACFEEGRRRIQHSQHSKN